MASKKPEVPCVICNPAEAGTGDYCDAHREELHRLDHQYESLFRLQRSSRGQGHETFELFVQGDCDPRGRVLVTETDPENLAITVLLHDDLDLESRLAGYSALGIEKTFADQLRGRIQQEIVFSWYGNARACVEVFRVSKLPPQHWDLEPRIDQGEEEGADTQPPATPKHSIH